MSEEKKEALVSSVGIDDKRDIKIKLKLNESGELFSSITEQTLVGISIIQDNLFKYVNQRYAEIGGYSVEEMMNWKPGEFIKTVHPVDRKMVMDQSMKKQKGLGDIINQYQLKALKKTGETIWLELISNTIIYKGKSAVLIMIIDITEKKKTEYKLKESEHKLRERVKELNCLYGLSKLAEDPNITIEGVIHATLEFIPPAWQSSNNTCARIVFGNKKFKTNNFKETEWRLSNSTTVGEKNLRIEVYYLENRPFLAEEKDLINEIGNRLKTIIEQKEAEQRINQAHSELSQIFTASIPMYVTDLDYNTIKVNERFCNLFQLKETEIIGKKCYDIWEGNLCHTPECSLKQILSGKEQYEYEIKKELDDGKLIYCIVKNYPFYGQNGELMGIIKNFTDISSRKLTEQKIRESEAKYRSVLENINEGYFEVDLEGNFTFFNDALCKSSGYSREELQNKSYSMVFDEETKERIFRVYNDLYKKGEGFTLIEYQILKKNGMRIYHESSIYLRSDSNGQIIGFKGFVRDISERKKVEAIRKKFSQELEKEVDLRTKELKVALDHQKLYLDQILKASNFKTEFLATMSHELRTPLNAIIGFTDLILEGVYGKLNSEQLEYIKDIEESSKHLLDMITHILDISKIESGQVTVTIDKIQLSNIIEQVISTLKPLYSKQSLKIELRGLKKKQIIYADPLKLKQIIYNLLSNAIKFTEKGTITLEFLDKKDNWEFNVKDTGIGIADKDFDIIFKDFKRVKSPYVDSMPGSGLGLSLTKRIINLHGGEISFTSKLGKGTTFTFNIPKKPKKVDRTVDIEEFLKYL